MAKEFVRPLVDRSPPQVPFFYHHVPKNLFLILLSIISFPLTAAVVVLSYIQKGQVFSDIQSYVDARHAKRAHHQNAATQKTILVTGVSMTKGLTITRLLSQYTPHRILGADTEPIPFISPGRYSNSISKFFRLTAPDGDNAEPYIDSLLSLLKRERVDLWISCSSVVAAVEDGEVANLATQALGPSFAAVQFSPEYVHRLHEKDSFIEYIESLDLLVPESHRCTSAAEVLHHLSAHDTANGTGKTEHPKRFLMKPIAVDDKARAAMMTLLPLSSPTETRKYVEKLGVSKQNPFQLQQYLGGAEYCTHALVIRGQVRAFTACPSSELLMHYRALPPSSPLVKQMIDFTRTVAHDGGKDFTGHLSFDFLAETESDAQSKTDVSTKLYPIECNPRAHTAVALFNSTPEYANAYLDLLPKPADPNEGNMLPDDAISPRSTSPPSYAEVTKAHLPPEIVYPRTPTVPYYWIGHDLVTLIIIPLLELIWGSTVSFTDVKEGFAEFLEHVLSWKDGTFEAWDPLPILVLYHVYWPARFAMCLLMGKRWSRVNVSTTKVFESEI